MRVLVIEDDDAVSAAIGRGPTPLPPTMQKELQKDYRVAIDTVPLPENPAERAQVVSRSVTPVINQIVSDAMNLAIGTWPTPDDPRLGRRP